MANKNAAATRLKALFEDNTNPYELGIFWTGAPLTIHVLRVNAIQIDSQQVYDTLVVRYNLPPPLNGVTYIVEAAMEAGTGAVENIVMGIKNDRTGKVVLVPLPKDAMGPGDPLLFVDAEKVKAP